MFTNRCSDGIRLTSTLDFENSIFAILDNEMYKSHLTISSRPQSNMRYD